MIKPLTLVSVIIPTRNRIDLAIGAVENVLKQTYTDIEMIVVEDGSKCGIEDYLKSLDDKRIHYHAHKVRKGLGGSRNTGTQIANGKYVAFLDDDERWLKDKIKLQFDLINSYASDRYMVYCGNCELNNGKIVLESIPKARGEMLQHFYRGYCIGSSCMMIPRESLLSIGGHSENLTSCIDHDLWLKLSQAGFHMDFVPKGLVYTVEHNHQRMMENIEERLKGIEEFFAKWEGIVKERAGEESWLRIEHIYHVQTAHMLLDQYRKGEISNNKLFRAIRKLLHIQQQRYIWLDTFLLRYGRIHLTPIKISKKEAAKSVVIFIKKRTPSIF